MKPTIRCFDRWKKFAVCALMAIGCMGAAVPQAQGDDNHHAMVSISNETNMPLKYEFRWGTGEWETYSLQIGNTMRHWFNFDRANEHRSPVPEIRFDADLTDGADFVRQELEAFAVPTTDDRGHIYEFWKVDNGLAVHLFDSEI